MPVDPTKEESEEMEKTEEKAFSSGFFLTAYEDDYNVVVPLSNLRPNTEYIYEAYVKLTTVMIGEVMRGTFKTLPAPREEAEFSFLFGSCLMSRSSPFEHIGFALPENALIATDPKPSFVMFLGDNVYLDAPWNLDARKAYELLFEDTGFRRFTWNFPSYFQHDDHEIRNDAEGRKRERERERNDFFISLYIDNESEDFKNKTAVYDRYLGVRNTGSLEYRYYSFWSGQAAIIVLDTRGK